jgi:soluble lytic murein transglycosylase-like protein
MRAACLLAAVALFGIVPAAARVDLHAAGADPAPSRQAGPVGQRVERDTPYADAINRVSAREGIDPRLVRAVIRVESAYQPNARSPKGAMGLMQLMPDTARLYDLVNPYDPVANIEAGVRHLKSLLTRLPVHLALAAYNAGEAAVQRYNGIPPYRETQDYVARVLQVASGQENYRVPASGWGATRAAAPGVRRFSFSRPSASRGGTSLPLRAARGPWRQGQPVRN